MAQLSLNKNERIEITILSNLLSNEDFTRKAIPFIKEEYFMWLEDDVIINQKVIDKFRYDINGYCPHSFKKETICELNKKYPFIEKDWDYRWSGHGGSIFNKQSFIGMAHCEDNAMDLLENWHKYHRKFFFHDDFRKRGVRSPG